MTVIRGEQNRSTHEKKIVVVVVVVVIIHNNNNTCNEYSFPAPTVGGKPAKDGMRHIVNLNYAAIISIIPWFYTFLQKVF